MTQAQVEKIVADAAKRGIHDVDEDETCTFLGAKELLTADPTNAVARQVVSEYTRRFTTGAKPTSFARFLLPIPYTDEEIAANEKRRADYIEIYRRYALVGITEGNYAAAQAFKAKHNLTCAQIMAMTDAEIKALAA